MEMNGHSLDDGNCEAEQESSSTEEEAEMKGGKSIESRKTQKPSRKMSNGGATENSDCTKHNSSASDEENTVENDHSVENISSDKSDEVSDNQKDKSDVADDVNDKSDKSNNVAADADSDSDTESAKEIIEIPEGDTDKNSVPEQNGEANNHTESTTKVKGKSPVRHNSPQKKDDSITETINDDESDIEMIEESDPLAISDVDVKLAREQKMKKNANLIIIDTNSILKTASSSVTTPKSMPKRQAKASATPPPPMPVTSLNMTASIQTALQAIAAGRPAMPGLHTAYANAIQQALLSQSNNVLTGPNYAHQLQQCYSSLGELQDEAYVIEAPSFIVPYVMEGKPKETIKDYLDKIKKDQEEEDKIKKDQEEEENTKKEAEKLKEGEISKSYQANDEDKTEEVDSTDNKSETKENKAEQQESTNDNEEIKADEDENTKGNEDKEREEGTKKEDDEECKGDKVQKEDDEKKSKRKNEFDEDYKPDTQADSDLSDNEENSKKDEDSKNDSDKENSKSAEEDDDVVALDKDDKSKDDMRHLGKWEPFYRSSLGKFFVNLGLNQVEEFIQNDIVKMTRRKLEKMKTNPSKQDLLSFKSLEYQLKRTREKNSHFNLDLKTCRHCTFKTESKLVMDKHLEAPHMSNYTYRCNFCEFETRGPQSILFHMEAIHNVKGRLERAPAFFQCPLCPFEENTKSKMTRHSFSCLKRYKPEKNCDLLDWEPPAKIPKQLHRGRANTQNRLQENSKMPGIFPKSFAGIPVSPNMMAAGSMQMNSNCRGRGRPVGSYKNLLPMAKNQAATLIYPATGAARFLNSLSGSNVAQQLSLASQVLQSVSSKSGTTKLPQQPSISITPLARGNQSTKNGSTSKDASKSTFVICEICDGYIKDLEQLRNHMNLIHKVKIHPKMIYNRPPLNCQKCQQRFFTDQGLERHLLGTHGLVTSSMQEAANKGKDSGRCPICGKVFQWKLLNHVSRDHKLTLKPAHLSYKCTVCTATFNMYRLFENHVYSAHSVVNKSKGGDSNSKKCSTGVDGPLKINDEITIIPQPSSKSKSDSGKSSKCNPTASVSKEITITKVGGSGSSRSAKKGVEIISLDESPAKRQLDEPRRKSAAKRAKLSQ